MFSVLALSTGSACSLWKASRLVRHNFPSMYSCLPCPNIFLSLHCLAISFRFIFSIPFLGVEVRLGLNFLKVEVIFILFQPSEFLPLTLISVILFDLSVIECSHNDISQPSICVVHLIMAHGSVCIQFI